MTSTLPIDLGEPFPIVGADAQTVLVETFVCHGAGCSSTNLHLRVTPAGDHELGYEVDDARSAVVLWDVATGALSTREGSPAAEALARVTDASTVEAWIVDQADRLRRRFDLHRAQVDSTLRTRPLPSWAPGQRLYHGELFPDFTPYVTVRETTWLILDAYCADPACPCRTASLRLVRMDAEDEETLDVVLDHSAPRQASTRGAMLWRAIEADDELVARLEKRRAGVREAGTLVVAEAYERARRERAQRSLERTPSPAGYRLGGDVSVSAIARLFDVMRDLVAADAWDCLRHDCLLRVDVSGAVSGTAWMQLDALLDSIDLLERPTLEDGTTPFTQLSLCFRSGVTSDHLRERCAYDWPLAPGGEVPLLERVDSDGEPHPPTAAETLRAVAASAALAEHARAIRALGDRHEPGEPLAPESWESVVSLDEGDLHVRLTASDACAPWPDPDVSPSMSSTPEELDAWGAGAEYDEDDEEWDASAEDDEDDDERVRVAREAFGDWAITCGASDPEVRLAVDLIELLDHYARAEDAATPWHEPALLEGFLTRYAPRKVSLDDADVEGTPAALERIVGWLTETEHYDAGTAAMARDVVERTAGTFRKRMRDPNAFGLAKSRFAQMARDNVDITDERAVQRYVDELNRKTMLAESLSAARRERDPARDVRERGSHRWQPAEGEKPPPPTDPCPCGSGRRYKKCCKPR